MDKKEQIRLSLQEMAQRFGPLNTILAQVTSVDESELTCELLADEIEMYEVRLTPVINNNQALVLIPKVNSWVLAARIEGDENWMVIAADQIDKFRVTIGGQVLEMDGSKYGIKTGSDDLKTMMSNFFDAVLNMKFTTNTGVTITLVNALEFQDLKTRFNAFLK